MKRLVISLLCFAFVSCVTAETGVEDPIGTLVQRLQASNGMWINGLVRGPNLPAGASPKEVVAEAVKYIGFDRGNVTTYLIREVRQVQPDIGIGSSNAYTAVWVDTNLGSKILLCKPLKDKGWWTRWYEIQKEKPNQGLQSQS